MKLETVIAENSSVVAIIVSVTLGAIVTYAVSRLTERHTAATAASNVEVTVRAALVEQMAHRITALEERIDAGFRRERQLSARYREDIEAIDTRWRHLANNMLTWMVQARRKLRVAGIEIEPFTGFEKFEAEGGSVRPEWTLDET